MFTPTKQELEELKFEFQQGKRIEGLLKMEDHYKKELQYNLYIIYSVIDNKFWLSDFDNNIKLPISSPSDLKTIISSFNPN